MFGGVRSTDFKGTVDGEKALHGASGAEVKTPRQEASGIQVLARKPSEPSAGV
jgi:hypothetical protein